MNQFTILFKQNQLLAGVWGYFGHKTGSLKSEIWIAVIKKYQYAYVQSQPEIKMPPYVNGIWQTEIKMPLYVNVQRQTEIKTRKYVNVRRQNETRLYQYAHVP